MTSLLFKNTFGEVPQRIRAIFYNFFYKNIQGRPSKECQRALAPLVFWSRSLKIFRKVLKSKSRSKKWHQLFVPSLGADDYI